jgi:hypothetical protein
MGNLAKWLIACAALVAVGCSQAFYNQEGDDEWRANSGFDLCLMDGGVDYNKWFNCLRVENSNDPRSMEDDAADRTCSTPEAGAVIQRCLLLSDASRVTTRCDTFLGSTTCTTN